jgi:hypothetical protein
MSFTTEPQIRRFQLRSFLILVQRGLKQRCSPPWKLSLMHHYGNSQAVGSGEAMHRDMNGYYEVRAQGPKREQFRLFLHP